jgi:hypothetical protein
MADVVKAEGLVIAYTDTSGNVYPLACAKNASIQITRELLELAPKSTNTFKRFIPSKRSFTISGSGLVKLVGSYQQGLDFFDDMFNTINTNYVAYLDIIDAQNNYKVYQFNCYITDLTLESTVGNFANYSYTLQGNGAFSQITNTNLVFVIDGYISARSTSSWKLVAIGYGGKWYYNYFVEIVDTLPVINMSTALNGQIIRAVYIAI